MIWREILRLKLLRPNHIKNLYFVKFANFLRT
jgi:hypothetical protein